MGNKRKIESEIDFKELLKNPIRLFGLVYIYFIVVAIGIGIYFVQSIDQISYNSVPGTSLDSLNIVREVETKVGGIKPSMDLGLVTNPTPEFIAKGKKEYLAVKGKKGDNLYMARINEDNSREFILYNSNSINVYDLSGAKLYDLCL